MDWEKMIEGANLPKRAFDNAESLLKKLLGPAITETGGLIADQIKFVRFKNQVKMFSRAQELLANNGITAKQINLKTLVPLIESGSLEEDEEIQNLWSNMIANISGHDTEQSLNLKCIGILKDIMPNEIRLLDYCFEIFKSEEQVTLKEWAEKKHFKDRTSVYPDNSVFATWEHKEKLGMTQDQLDLYTDRLISFGIFKHEQPELKEYKSNQNVKDIFSGFENKIETKSYELETSERVVFTTFGLYFVKICKYEQPKSAE